MALARKTVVYKEPLASNLSPIHHVIYCERAVVVPWLEEDFLLWKTSLCCIKMYCLCLVAPMLYLVYPAVLIFQLSIVLIHIPWY